MYNEKYREGGFTPYVAPNIKVEPNKEIVYDDVGNIKAIIDREMLDKKLKQDNKDELIRVIKKAAILVGLFAVATAVVGFILNVVSSIL